jgi:hypothetical protein
MPQFVRKYWKRWLLAAAMVLLCPLILIGFLWWDNLPKPDARVSIGYLRTTTQGSSNVVTFVVTNQSDFPVSFAIFFEAHNPNFKGGWEPVFPNQARPVVSQAPALTTSLITVPVFSTNRWKVKIGGGDNRVSQLDEMRRWVAGVIFKYGSYPGGWRLATALTGARARAYATGPEMLGDSPAP